MQAVVSLKKVRISRKFLSALPAEVAQAVLDAQQGHPNIKSLTFKVIEPAHEFYVGEGENYSLLLGDARRNIEVVGEATIGAAGVVHAIGQKFSAPDGAWVMVVGYYSGYWLDLYNVQAKQPALPEPAAVGVASLSSENPSKAQEMNVLRTVAANIPPTWYLHDLYSLDLIAWVDQQISGDIMPDIFALYQQTERNRHNMETLADDMARSVERERQRVTALQAEINADGERIQELLSAVNAAQQNEAEARDEFHRLQSDVHIGQRAAVETLRLRDEEITRLKVRLYDLEHPDDFFLGAADHK